MTVTVRERQWPYLVAIIIGVNITINFNNAYELFEEERDAIAVLEREREHNADVNMSKIST